MGSGDYAWMLTATALVVFMVPGLALFYGGMVRSRNVLNMLLMNMACIGIVPIVWVLISYTLGNSSGGGGFFGGDWIGNFDAIGLDGLNGDAESLIFVAFLMTFASITPALISGAVADRMKFSAWLVFVPLWLVLVYTPVTYWVYSGWHHGNGALDFAGGTAIHLNAGVAALALVLVLGRRRGWPRESMPPHNVPMVLIGTGILWFGWFGFNAGSGLAADGIAVSAFLVTNTCAATGMMMWVFLGMIHSNKVSGVGAATGAIAGLATITPAAGFVGAGPAIIIGIVSGAVTYYAVYFKNLFSLDDALDVFAVHGLGGLLGLIGAGIFATEGGLINGSSELLINNLILIVSTFAYSIVATFVILKVLDVIPGVGLRASQEDEDKGLDISDHGERAYVADGAD